MARLQNIFAVLILATPLIVGLPFSKENDVLPTPLNLSFVGTVDGISYFAEANQTMTWFEARLHCKTAGMELASIKTQNVSHALNALLWEKYPTGAFWISDRDFERSISTLAWDDGEERVEDTAFKWIGYIGPGGHYDCGSVNVGERNEVLHMYTALCLWDYFVLCQTE